MEMPQNSEVLKELACLRALKAELETIIESIHDEIYVTDAEGTTLRVNSACKRFYGLSPQELIGKNVNAIANMGIFYPVLTPKVVKEKRPFSTLQITQSGREVIVSANPVFDSEGNVIRVVSITKDITEINQLKKELEDTENMMKNYKTQLHEMQTKNKELTGNIISRSKEMKDIMELATKIACYDSTVLIYGESGVGKGLLAKYIHSISNRKDAPFITVNCGAIPGNLLESELFGYEKGAFTGANVEGKPGLFELADKGTLFLDEVSELPLSLQVKLLTAIQEKTITKIGGNKPIKIDFRLIVAANKSLELLVKKGVFREDLYYRLNVIPIEIPPLRERTDDIVPLVYHFLAYFGNQYKKQLSVSPRTLDHLISYSWPGNIRELENIIERLVVTVDHYEIQPQQLPLHLKSDAALIKLKQAEGKNFALKESVESLEKDIILKAYKELKSSYKVAKLLNISQSAVARRIKKYNLEVAEHKKE